MMTANQKYAVQAIKWKILYDSKTEKQSIYYGISKTTDYRKFKYFYFQKYYKLPQFMWSLFLKYEKKELSEFTILFH